MSKWIGTILYFCPRCGFVGRGGERVQCPDCCAVLDVKVVKGTRASILLEFVVLVALALAVAIAVLAFTGCSGPHFYAADNAELMSPAGAGGYSQTMSQAGAGGAGVGGKSNPSAGASGSAGAAEAGAGGAAPDVVHACDRALWTATAFGWNFVTDANGIALSGGPPSCVVDADQSSTWTSGANQAPGQWLEIDLGAPSTLSEITLRGSELPAVTLELDGEPVAVSTRSSSGALTLRFAPAPARVVRLELERAAAAWWQLSDVAAVCQ